MGEQVAEQIVLIPLDKLSPHPQNPRRDMGDLTELAASIKEIGVIEPIAVVERDGKFLAVTGSRRAAASRLAGAKSIPARVMSMDEQQAAAAALIENLQRKDLTPLEEAEAYRSYLTLTGGTQAELAKKIGRGASTIANALRLLEAPKIVKDALAAGTITAAHARVALTVPAEVASGLTLKAGITVEALSEEAKQITQHHAVIVKLKQDLGAAVDSGKVATWTTAKVWMRSQQFDLGQILGKPPVRIQGEVAKGYTSIGGTYGEGDPAKHDRICTCRAVAPAPDSHVDSKTIPLGRVCVSVEGWRKYVAAIKPKRSGSVTAASQTPAQREKARLKAIKDAQDAGARALAGQTRYDKHAHVKPDARLLKGGIDGEAARLALFGVQAQGGSEWTPRWRAALWDLIAKMPIKEVRERLLAALVDLGVNETARRADERFALQTAVLGHYGIEVEEPKAKKPAKRKAA